jgi:hypothetical protein
LDEAGKLLERIVASRIIHHLTHTGPDLAKSQHGFREGRSTIDAIMSVKAFSDEEVDTVERHGCYCNIVGHF